MTEDHIITADGVLEKYTGIGGEAVIPDGVKRIGKDAFSYCSDLKSVVFPDSVTAVGDRAFCSCHMLKKVLFGKGLTEIGSSAFANCLSLSDITFPEGLNKLGNNAFSNCCSLSSVSLPEGITGICNGAFMGCVSLRELNIPKSIRRIGSAAFYECRSLTGTVIPDGVKFVGSRAFGKCSKLEALTLPESVIEIGSEAFAECPGLKRFEILCSTVRVTYKTAVYSDIFCRQISKYHTLADIYPVENIEEIYIPAADFHHFRPAQKLIYTLYYLTCPGRHSPEEQEMYSSFFAENSSALIKLIIMFNTVSAMPAVLSGKTISLAKADECIEIASREKKTELLAMLMEYKQKFFTSEELENEQRSRLELPPD